METTVVRIDITDPRAIAFETCRIKCTPLKHDRKDWMVTKAVKVGNTVQFTIKELP